MRAAGAVAGGLAGLACMYLTLAANGGSYANTATKGAVMVALLSACTFGFSLLRFRHPRFWFAFTVATFRCGGAPCLAACRRTGSFASAAPAGGTRLQRAARGGSRRGGHTCTCCRARDAPAMGRRCAGPASKHRLAPHPPPPTPALPAPRSMPMVALNPYYLDFVQYRVSERAASQL